MSIPDSVAALERDLRAIFGDRMQSFVLYAASRPAGTPKATLAVVSSLTTGDLRDCAARVVTWQEAGLATPLILEAHEFGRSLDAFPYEFGAILADYQVIAGSDPFSGLQVDASDLRRACEIQARSHLMHLREAFIETRGRSDALADLIGRSSLPLTALLENVARLGMQAHDPALDRVVALRGHAPTSNQARELFPPYLAAVQQLTQHIDRWRS